MKKILILNGPNIHLLGQREPGLYGHHTLQSISEILDTIAKKNNIALVHEQSNYEGRLIDILSEASAQNISFIIFNPAAFTHTSIALRDTLLAINIPFIEVHLSNIYARESFRHHSYFSDISAGVISGLGPKGYQLALEAAITHLALDN